MNGRTPFFGLILAAGIAGLGYVVAKGWPFDHGIVFLALVAGFIICDRSFWPGRFR